MPFKSKAQRRALYAKDPSLAAEFEKKTKKNIKLPERVKKKNKLIDDKKIRSPKRDRNRSY